MPSAALPMEPAELAHRLSRGLAPRPNGLELRVTDAQLTEVVDAPRGTPPLELRLRVTATTSADADGQEWQVSIPLDVEDIDPAINPSSFVITLRANLEEWWDVKDQEEDVASWGRRLG